MNIVNWALGFWPGAVRCAKAAPDFASSTNGKIIICITAAILVGAAVLHKAGKRDAPIAKPAEIAAPVKPKTPPKSAPVKRTHKRVDVIVEQAPQDRCRKVYPAGPNFPPYYVCSAK